MNVLLVYTDKDAPNDNPYVKTLKDGLESVGCKVDWGLKKFWTDYNKYDIIHFQWPESIFDWRNITDSDINKLNSHLLKLKAENKKIVYTRHNIEPHYSKDRNVIKLYDLIERNCDVMLHMGNYSLNQFKEKSNKNETKHYIIPHHTYDDIYTSIIDKLTARKKLEIDNNKFVFLCFGAFRDDEERTMVIKSFTKLNYQNKFLLAPRFYRYKMNVKHPRAFLKGIIERLKFINLSKNMRLSAKFIDNQMLPYYFSAADVIFIQRCKILNSGNIPMAFLFEKAVIAPNVGNVGEITEETGNITFNPSDLLSIIDAMKKSIEKVHSKQGNKNKEYATLDLNTKRMSRQIKQIYDSLL